MSKTLLPVAALCLLALAFPVQEEGAWLSWRGPDGTGVADGSPPVEWAEDRNVTWKIDTPGLGSSTPIYHDGRLYLLSAVGGEAPAGEGRRPAPPSGPVEFTVLAYDAADGSEIWRDVARSQAPYAGKHPTNSYASASALTDGEMLWAFFGSYGLHAYDLEGNKQWELDFGRMQTRNDFGEGASPALHGDSLVVIWDQEPESWVAAFDKRSGEEIWRTARDEPSTWATPVIVEHDGTTQVLTAGTNRVRSYDLADGSLLWEGPGLTLNAIPSPMVRDGVAYFAAGFRGSALMAVDLDRASGNIDGTDAILWRIERDTPYVPTPLLYGDVLYYVKSNDAILSAVRPSTGELLFGPQRLDGVREIYASPVGAGGHVYILGRDGGGLVLRHGDTYEVVATNELDDGFDATPVIIGSSMFLRGREYLYRIDPDGTAAR